MVLSGFVRRRRRNPKATFGQSIQARIYRVLKQIHPNLGISMIAMRITSDLISHLAERLLRESEFLTNFIACQKTLSIREFQSAVRLVLPGELAKHAVSLMNKSLAKILDKETTNTRVTVSRSKRAGLSFPVALVSAFVRRHKQSSRVGRLVPFGLAAVLEYVTAEVLELAGDQSRDDHRLRIAPRHIFFALSNDDDLSRLFLSDRCPHGHRGIIKGGGVSPLIHQSLIAGAIQRVKQLYPETTDQEIEESQRGENDSSSESDM
jgi:histone H2A